MLDRQKTRYWLHWRTTLIVTRKQEVDVVLFELSILNLGDEYGAPISHYA